jgi:hypothetical protein
MLAYLGYRVWRSRRTLDLPTMTFREFQRITRDRPNARKAFRKSLRQWLAGMPV